MAKYPIGDLFFNGYRFTGRKLDGRSRGEQINVPLEGDQGATKVYMIREDEIETFLTFVLGTVDDSGQITAPPHYLLDRFYAVGVTLTPMQPNTPTQDADGLAQLAAQFNSGAVGGAAAWELQQTLADAITGNDYQMWQAVVQWQEDRGWEEEYRDSSKVAAVDIVVPASAGQVTYPTKFPVPFAEATLTLSRRRIVAFDPSEMLSSYANKINSSAITLPSGKTIPQYCAMFSTWSAKYHNVSYGAKYWSATVDLRIQPYSWNLVPHRKTGSLVALKRPDNTDLFSSADFNPILQLK